MKYRLTLVWIIGILFSLGIPVLAQTEESVKVRQADEVLIQAVENTIKAKNYRVEGKISTEMGSGEEEEKGFEIEAVFKGINKNPDLSYMTIEAMGHQMEIYRQGDKVVMKSPMTGEWIKPPKMPGMMQGFMPLKQIALLKDCLKDVKFSGAEQINQKDYVVIEGSLDPEAMTKIMKKRAGPMAELAKINLEKARFKTWCDKEKSLLYKSQLSTIANAEFGLGGFGPFEPGEDEAETEEEEEPMKMTIKMTMEVTFSDYDKEIELEIPDEVKRILESEEEEESEEEDEEDF